MSVPEKTIRARFKFIGPVTRNTLPDENADPRGEALNDVLHWLWSTRVQIRRFTADIRVEVQQPDCSAIENRQLSSLTSLDEHLLLVVAGQLEKAVGAANEHCPTLVIPDDLRLALRDLRNVYEHWEQQREAFRRPGSPKERSGKSFETHFPGGQPWSVDIYPGRDIVLAKVVSLRALVRELRKLERIVLALEHS